MTEPIFLSSDPDKHPEVGRILVWDFPIRAFHWLLVLSLCGSWITAESGFDYFEYHLYFGYFSLGLVAFRVSWGFLGPTYARFFQFLKSPVAGLIDLRQLFQRQPANHAGHSASGGWSVMLLLLLVTVQAGTGMFISDDIFYSGPYNGVVSNDLAGQLASIHHLNFTALQIFAALHIAVIFWYLFGKRENLIKPMFTGLKVTQGRHQPIPSQRLLIALGLCTLIAIGVYLIVTLAPPPASIYF